MVLGEATQSLETLAFSVFFSEDSNNIYVTVIKRLKKTVHANLKQGAQNRVFNKSLSLLFFKLITNYNTHLKFWVLRDCRCYEEDKTKFYKLKQNSNILLKYLLAFPKSTLGQQNHNLNQF